MYYSRCKSFRYIYWVGIDTPAAQAQNTTVNQTLGTNISQTVIGSQINLRATTVNTLFGIVRSYGLTN
jgi:hypothetical protein